MAKRGRRKTYTRKKTYKKTYRKKSMRRKTSKRRKVSKRRYRGGDDDDYGWCGVTWGRPKPSADAQAHDYNTKRWTRDKNMRKIWWYKCKHCDDEKPGGWWKAQGVDDPDV
jgi:hypothetical protein